MSPTTERTIERAIDICATSFYGDLCSNYTSFHHFTSQICRKYTKTHLGFAD